jgi:hypothetical protein
VAAPCVAGSDWNSGSANKAACTWFASTATTTSALISGVFSLEISL